MKEKMFDTENQATILLIHMEHPVVTVTNLYFHNTISFTYCINVNLFFQAQINSRLQRHKNDVHYKIKDFQCWKCPKRFNSQTVLNKHLVAVHKEVLDDDKKMKVTEKQIGEFSIITD